MDNVPWKIEALGVWRTFGILITMPASHIHPTGNGAMRHINDRRAIEFVIRRCLLGKGQQQYEQ